MNKYAYNSRQLQCLLQQIQENWTSRMCLVSPAEAATTSQDSCKSNYTSESRGLKSYSPGLTVFVYYIITPPFLVIFNL